MQTTDQQIRRACAEALAAIDNAFEQRDWRITYLTGECRVAETLVDLGRREAALERLHFIHGAMWAWGLLTIDEVIHQRDRVRD